MSRGERRRYNKRGRKREHAREELEIVAEEREKGRGVKARI